MTAHVALQMSLLFFVLCCRMLPQNVCSINHQQHHQHHKSQKRLHFKLFEGDIAPEYYQVLDTYGSNVTEELVNLGIFSPHQEELRRVVPAAGSSEYFRIWSKNRINDITLIPYEFVEGGIFTDAERSMMIHAMENVSRRVNIIQFVPRKEQSVPQKLPYLRFTDDRVNRTNPATSWYPSCFSYIGWQGEHHQQINLAKDSFGCFFAGQGLLGHWLLHTLGLWHTQSRYDRDQYVRIAWENVAPGLEHDLRKKVPDDTLGLPYDYDSLMHDAHDDFSGNGNDTIVAPVPIGLLEGMSSGDVVLLHMLYQCRSGPRTYNDYMAHPCTEDCPCWEDDKSIGYKDDQTNQVIKIPPKKCFGSHSVCRGDLICSAQTDRCVRLASTEGSRTVYPLRTKSFLPRQAKWTSFANPIYHSAAFSNILPAVVLFFFGLILLLTVTKLAERYTRALHRRRMQYKNLS